MENQSDQSHSSSQWGKLAPTIAITMFVLFFSIVVLLHFLRADLSPLSTFVSDYATGPYGILMIVAFLNFGSGFLALALSIFAIPLWKTRPWIPIVLLLIAAVLMIIVAIYPSDAPGQMSTRTGEIHNQASGFVFLLLLATMLILSVKLWASGMLQGWYWILLPVSIAAPIILVVAFTVLDDIGLVGLGQRIFLVTMLSWLILFSIGIGNQSFTRNTS